MKNITIIENGKSKYQILIAKTASSSIEWAASELQRILFKMTGVRLLIANEPETNPKIGLIDVKAIIIGSHYLLDKLKIVNDLEKYGDEGYGISVRDENIVITGSDKRGAMYGVFSMLEKYMGVRWFTADVEYVPEKNAVILPGDICEEFVPSLEYREASFWESSHDGAWNAHNKCNGHFNQLASYHGGKNTYFPFVHSFDMLVPADKYYDSHPEYFSEVDGKRLRQNTQLCLSNNDVFEIALKQVRKWIAENPEATIVSISQNDGYNPCQCEKCRKIDEYEESHAGSLINFVNKIADAVSLEFPDVLIDTLAYVYTRKPPRYVRPRPNVIVRMCSIECCFSHPVEECREIVYPYKTPKWKPKTHFADDVQKWAKIHNRLYVWDYVTNFAHSFMPFPNFGVLKQNIEFFIKNNVKGIFEQGALWQGGGGSMAELRNYVLAKLLWDSSLDSSKCVEEFISGVFKSAAPFMQKYFELIHSKVQSIHLGIYDPADDTYENDVTIQNVYNTMEEMRKNGASEAEIENYNITMKTFSLTEEKLGFLTKDMIEEANLLFDEMERNADDEAVLKRVQRERLGIRYIELYLEKTDEETHRKNVDEFISDVQKQGILCVSENRYIESSREMMYEQKMHLWNCAW